MISQALRLHVKRVEVSQEEWEKVRRRLIERLPLYDKRPDLYVEAKYGKKSKKKTGTVKDSLSPQWDAPLEIIVANKNEKLVLEILHSTFLNVRNPRVGRISLSLDELLSESKERDVLRDLNSPQGSEVIGKITLRLSTINTYDVLEEVGEGIANLHCSEESGIYDAIGEFLELIEPYMSAIDQVSGINLYLNSGWKIISSLPKIALKQYITNNKITELVKEMTETFRCAKEIGGFSNKNGSLERAALCLSCEINECCLFIREYLGHGFFGRMVSPKSQNRIDDFRKAFEGIRNQFHLAATVQGVTSNFKIESSISRFQKSIDLHSVEDRLKPEASTGTPHSTCFPGTRTEIIEMIIDELMGIDNHNNNIIWMNGPAGCGKSTIALSIAEHFGKLSRLGGYIYFTRGKSQPDIVIRTIAYKLASMDSSVAEYILESDPNYMVLTLQTQFEQLLLLPLQKAAEKFNGPIVIILDALDECGDSTSRTKFLELIHNGAFMTLPKNVRILITSRPDNDIMCAMGSQGGSISHIQIDPTDSRSKEDVSLYLRKALISSLERRLGGLMPKDWPLESDLEKVTRAANGLFIWASLFVNLVSSDDLPIKAFVDLVERIRSSSNLYGLDEMYHTVLSGCRAFKSYKDKLNEILTVLLLTPKSISAEGIDELLGCSQGETRLLLSGLQSVVLLSDSDPVRFFHASFPDFLTGKCRSGEYFVDTSKYSSSISERCFNVMLRNGGLRVNICNLQSSLFKYESISEIRNYISEQLECACTLWSCMCSQDSVKTALVSMFKKFVDGYLFQWFEALSLTKSFHLASPMLLTAIRWATIYVEDYVLKLKEARRLAYKYYIPISQSAPHAYLSVFPFEDGSIITKQYCHLVIPVVSVHEEGDRPENFLLNKWQAHDKNMRRVVFTPDGNFIMSCDYKTIKVWNSHTATTSGVPISVNEDTQIQDFILSSEGSKLAALLYTSKTHGSGAKISIGLWDTKSWESLVQPFPAGYVCALRFIKTKWGEHLGTCSIDGTISLWSLNDGMPLDNPERVERLYSGKNCILVDPSSYYVNEKMDEVGGDGNVDDRDEIKQALFSPTGCRIAFFHFSESLSIWNWGENEAICVRRNPKFIHAMSGRMNFSPDGMIVLYQRFPQKVELMNAITGAFIKSFFTDYPVSAFAISHNGMFLATAGKDLALWDIESGELLMETDSYNDDANVSSVEFSTDGSRILLGRTHGRIEVYDAEIRRGKPKIENRDMDHRDHPWKVAFTEDRDLVSLWNDNYIRKWEENSESISEIKIDELERLFLTRDGKRVMPVGFSVSDSNDENNHRQKFHFHSNSSLEIIHTDKIERTQSNLLPLTREKSKEEGPSSKSETFLPLSYNFNGRIIAIVFDKAVHIWEQMEGDGSDYKYIKDVSTETLPKSEEKGMWGRYIAAVSSDGSHVVFLYARKSFAILVDTSNGDKSHELHTTAATRNLSTSYSHSSVSHNELYRIAFSPHEPCIACVTDFTVTIYSTVNGQTLFELQGLKEDVFSIAYSQDGTRLAAGSIDGTVVVWDIKSKDPIFGPLRAHHREILIPSISYDNSRLATASRDGSIRVYDLGDVQTPISMELGYDPAFRSALHTWAFEFSDKVDRFSSWSIGRDGWIQDDQGQFLLWVPPDVRLALCHPKSVTAVGLPYTVYLIFRCD